MGRATLQTEVGLSRLFFAVSVNPGLGKGLEVRRRPHIDRTDPSKSPGRRFLLAQRLQTISLTGVPNASAEAMRTLVLLGLTNPAQLTN